MKNNDIVRGLREARVRGFASPLGGGAVEVLKRQVKDICAENAKLRADVASISVRLLALECR